MKQNIQVKGLVTIKKIRNGEVIDVLKKQNLVVQTGLEYFVDKILGDTADDITAIAIGTSSTAAASNQTDLIGTKYTVAHRNLLNSGQSILVESYFGDSSYDGNDVGEIGLFAESTLIARVAITPFQKILGEDISISWEITFGA